MNRFVVVPVIAVAVTVCAPRPSLALQHKESPAIAVDEEVQRIQESIRQIVRADYAGDRQALDCPYMADFNASAEKRGGALRPIDAHLRTLDAVRKGVRVVKAPLDLSWGEAELCLNLAYSYLNIPAPDVALARKYVDEASVLVPDWHCARNIPLPQIEAAALNAEREAVETSVKLGRLNKMMASRRSRSGVFDCQGGKQL